MYKILKKKVFKNISSSQCYISARIHMYIIPQDTFWEFFSENCFQIKLSNPYTYRALTS